jgi:hypothetical protein
MTIDPVLEMRASFRLQRFIIYTPCSVAQVTRSGWVLSPTDPLLEKLARLYHMLARVTHANKGLYHNLMLARVSNLNHASKGLYHNLMLARVSNLDHASKGLYQNLMLARVSNLNHASKGLYQNLMLARVSTRTSCWQGSRP